MLTARGTTDFRQLYPICMTDNDFEKMGKQIPGHIEGIYLLDWTATGRYEGLAEARKPKTRRRRSAENKVTIAFKHCSYQIVTPKQSLKDALRKGDYNPSECLINTIYDNFQDKLLRPDKTRNLITRGRHRGWLDH